MMFEAGGLSVGTLVGGIEFEDNATDKLIRVEDQFRRLGFGVIEVGRAMQSFGGILTATVTAPLVAASAASLSFASGFESGMTRVITLAGASRAEVAGLTDEVLRLASEVGESPAELAKGLVQVESAGYRGKQALDILATSGRMTAIGMGSVEDNTLALVGALRAFEGQGLTAAQAGDILVKTIQLGNDKVDALIPALARVTPVAAAFGVSFADINASIATFTHLGASTDVAATGIRAILATILNDGPKTEKGLAAIGISMDDLRKQIVEKGLTEALINLVRTANSLPNGLDKLQDVFGNIRALTAVLATAGSQATQYQSTTDQIRSATGTLVDAFGVTAETFEMLWKRLKVDLEKVGLEIGKGISPIIRELVDLLRGSIIPAVSSAVSVWQKLPEPIRDVSLAFGLVIVAGGPLLLFFGELVTSIGHVMRAIAFLKGTQLASWVTGLIPQFGSITTSLGGLTTALSGSSVAVGALTAGLAGLAASIALTVILRHFDESLEHIKKKFQQALNELTPEGQMINAAERFIDPNQRDLAKKIIEERKRLSILDDIPITGAQTKIKLTPVLELNKNQLSDMARALSANLEPLQSGISLNLRQSTQDQEKEVKATEAAARAKNFAKLNTDLYSTSLSKLDEATKSYALNAFRHGFSVSEVVQKLVDEKIESKNVEGALSLLHKQVTAGAEAQKKYANAWTELNSLGRTAAETIAGVNSGIVAEVSYLLGLGASIQKVADAYPFLTKEQIEAIDAMNDFNNQFGKLDENQVRAIAAAVKHGDSLNNLAVILGINDKLVQQFANTLNRLAQIQNAVPGEINLPTSLADLEAGAAFESTNKAYDIQKDYHDKVLDLWKTGTQGELDAIERARQQAIMDVPLNISSQDMEKAFDQINTYFDALRTNVFFDTEAIRDNTQEHLEEVAEKARNTFEFMSLHPEKYSKATVARFKEIALAAEHAAFDVHFAFINTFDKLADSLTRLAQVSGDAFGGWAKKLSVFIVELATAAKATKDLINARNKMEFATAAVGVAAAFASATDPKTHSRAGGIASGAATGAQVGWMIGSVIPVVGSILGAIVGAGVGALVGFVRSFKSSVDQAKNIAKDLEKEGGLSAANYETYATRLKSVFIMIESHQMTIAEGAKVIGENWDTFVQASTSRVGLLSANMVQLIRLNDLYGMGVKNIAEYLKGQLTNAITALTSALTSRSKVGQISTQAEADAVASSLVSIFARMSALGIPMVDILKQMEKAINALAKQMGGLGLQQNTAFITLKALSDLFKSNIFGPVIQQAIDWGNALVGLNNSAILTQDMFTTVAEQIVKAFNRLVGGGVDSKLALLALQGPLQQLWELHHNLGFEIDDNLASILAKAEAAHIVGAQQRDVYHQMLDVLIEIARVLGADIPAGLDRAREAAERFGGAMGAAAEAAARAAGAFAATAGRTSGRSSGSSGSSSGSTPIDVNPPTQSGGEERQSNYYSDGMTGSKSVTIQIPVTVNLPNAIVIEPYVKDMLAKELGPAIMQQIYFNFDSMFTKQIATLGQKS